MSLDVSTVMIDDCREGDIIAADVFTASGIKLVSRETVINRFIRQHLYESGVENVTIYCRDNPSEKPSENSAADPHTGDGAEDLSDEGPEIAAMAGHYRRSAVCIRGILKNLAAGKRLDREKIFYISDIIYRYVDDSDEILRCLDLIRSRRFTDYSHSINTAFYSMLIAKWAGLKSRDISRAVQAGLLHDIGKAKIPPSVLDKAEPLTNAEFSLLRKHPVYGYYLLDESGIVDVEIKRVALLHHERVNRTGYPFHISSEYIGLFTKIVSVADVFDAMTTNRVYKRSVNILKSFEMFLTEGVCLFDREILTGFVDHMTSYLVGSEVVMNTGEHGTIIYIPPGDILSPIIQLGSEYVNLRNRRDLSVEKIL